MSLPRLNLPALLIKRALKNSTTWQQRSTGKAEVSARDDGRPYTSLTRPIDEKYFASVVPRLTSFAPHPSFLATPESSPPSEDGSSGTSHRADGGADWRGSR